MGLVLKGLRYYSFNKTSFDNVLTRLNDVFSFVLIHIMIQLCDIFGLVFIYTIIGIKEKNTTLIFDLKGTLMQI